LTLSILNRIGSWGRKAVPGVALAITVAAPVTGQYRPTAITNVNIVPMDRETVLENMTIVVRNGVIESLLPSADTDIPDNARVIDANGRYLLPGLTDMHVHVRTADALELYIARGFTTVRDMNGFLGDPIGWRAAVQRGDIVGPRLITATARDVVPVAHGHDLIKVCRTPRESFFALMEGAKKQGIPVAGYIPDRSLAEANVDGPGFTIDEVANAGMVSLEHMWEVAGAAAGDHPDGFIRLREKARELRTSGTAIATLLMSSLNYNELWVRRGSFFKGKRVKLANEYTGADGVAATYRMMDGQTDVEPLDRSLLLETLKLFHEENVDVVIGTDSHGPLEIAGLSAFDEMDLFVEAGLSPYDALRAATITPAKVLGRLETSGTVAVGKNADFVLVDGNPLENLDVLRKPVAVMAQGRWLDRDELRYILADAIESMTWCPTRRCS
jgi:hypothetical protein